MNYHGESIDLLHVHTATSSSTYPPARTRMRDDLVFSNIAVGLWFAQKSVAYIGSLHLTPSSKHIMSIVCCGAVQIMAVARAALLRLVPVRPDTMKQDSQEDIPCDLFHEVLYFQSTAYLMRFDSFESLVGAVAFD